MESETMSTVSNNLSQVFMRVIKYIIEGTAVALAAYYIPRKKMEVKEIAMIAVTAAAIFAVLDLWAPRVGFAARQGTGFGIGANLVGYQGVGVPSA
jgi:hypothetical protein